MPPSSLAPGERVQKYIDGVIDGTIPVGTLQKLTVERHLKDLLEAEKKGLWFDESEGERVCAFFEEYLCHTLDREFAGKPFILEPWQSFVLYCLFGWKKLSDNYRRFRTSYMCVSRKNGKSTFAAGVGLYLTVADGEPGAEVYSAATRKEQARIVHAEATRMVKRSKRLKRYIEPLRNVLTVTENDSKYEPLSADVSKLDGLNVHGAIVDELHKHKNREIFDLMVTAGISRKQPLVFCITNAGDDREGVCWEQQSYSEKILKGLIEDDSHFAFITTIDDDDDWKDENVWAKANPSLGVTVQIDRLRSECKKAQESPAFEAAFRRYYLSQWWQRANRAIRDEDWTATAYGGGDEIKYRDLEKSVVGLTAFCGLDLSSTTDITAFVMVIPVDGQFVVLSRFWVPEDRVTERSSTSVPYRHWVERGYLYATPGNIIDYGFVREKVNELSKAYRLKEIAYDPWNATKLVTELQDDGFEMVAFPQTFRYISSPTKELVTQVLKRNVVHAQHPVMRWMASNFAVIMDSNANIRPHKDKSENKIDGIVALIMGLGRAVVTGEQKPSVYESRGIISL